MTAKDMLTLGASAASSVRGQLSRFFRTSGKDIHHCRRRFYVETTHLMLASREERGKGEGPVRKSTNTVSHLLSAPPPPSDAIG